MDHLSSRPAGAVLREGWYWALPGSAPSPQKVAALLHPSSQPFAAAKGEAHPPSPRPSLPPRGFPQGGVEVWEE